MDAIVVVLLLAIEAECESLDDQACGEDMVGGMVVGAEVVELLLVGAPVVGLLHAWASHYNSWGSSGGCNRGGT